MTGMTDLPCINPVCDHRFSAHEVAGAYVLLCPRCGQQFQVRAGGPTAAPAKPAPPAKKTPAAPSPRPPAPKPQRTPPLMAKPFIMPPAQTPRAAPVPPPQAAPPVAMPPGPHRSAPLDFSNSDPLPDLDTISTGRAAVASRPEARRWSYVTVFAIGFILLGAVLAVFLGIRRFGGGGDAESKYAGPTKTTPYAIFNFEKAKEVVFNIIVPSDSDWTPSHDFEKKLNLQAEWYDKGKDVWLGVSAADFGLFKPREPELIRTGMDQLYTLFGETLEMEQLPKSSKVAGKSARKLEFKGRDGAVIRWGEMHMFSHRGVAFWVYVLGPDLETCQTSLDWLEKRDLGVALDSDMRKGWRQQPPRMESFTSISGRVSLTVPHGIYEKQEAPMEKGVDIPADLYLLGRYRKEKDNRKNAHVQVVQLEPQANLDDAMKRAKAHVLALASAGGGVGYTLVVSPDADGEAETGRDVDLRGRKAKTGDFCMLLNDKRERFFTISVVSDADRMYVIACDVIWENRQIWGEDFHDLFLTTKISKGMP